MNASLAAIAAATCVETPREVIVVGVHEDISLRMTAGPALVKQALVLFSRLVNRCSEGRRGGAVARTLSSHQCDPGSTPGLGSM